MGSFHVRANIKRNITVLAFTVSLLFTPAMMAAFTCSHSLTEANFTPGADITLNINYNFGGDTVTGLGAEVLVPPGWGQGSGMLTWVAPSGAIPGLPGLTYTNNQETFANFLYNRIEFSFGSTAFGTFSSLPSPTGTLTFKIRVPATANVNDNYFIRVRLLPTINEFAQTMESTSNPLTVPPPAPPTFSNANPANGSLNTNPPTNTVTAGQEITFTVSIAPAANTSLTLTGFSLQPALWDATHTRWYGNDPLTYTPSDTDNYIGFQSAGTGSVGTQRSITLNGHIFKWTQVTNGTTEAPGVRTFTWVVPSDFTNKATGPKFVVADIGGKQANLGEDSFRWAAQVNPVNQIPQITEFSGTLNGTPIVDSTVASGYENDAVHLSVTATDADVTDVLTYAWFYKDATGWHQIDNGRAFVTTPTLDGNIPYTIVAHPNTTFANFQVKCVVSDGDSGTAEQIWTITTLHDMNRLPTINGTAALTGGANTNDPVICTLTGNGADADAEDLTYGFQYRFVWSKNGTATVTHTNALGVKTDTLSAAETKKGESWTCAVYAVDQMGELALTPVTGTAAVVIGNTQPALSPAIADVFIRKTDGLPPVTANINLASLFPITDPDKTPDGIDTAYTWTITTGPTKGTIGTFNAVAGTLVYTVTTPATEFFDANADTFTVTVSDNGPTNASSDPVTVRITYRANQVPAISPGTAPASPQNEVTAGGLAQVFTFNASAADPDGTIQHVFWKVGAASVYTTESTLGAGGASSYAYTTAGYGEVIHPAKSKALQVFVKYVDNLGSSSEYTFNLTINDVDRLPNAPIVTITPASPKTTDDLTANVTTPATDPDGDAITGYDYSWAKGGAPIAGQVLANAQTKKGETWTVTVKAKANPYNEGDVISTNGGTANVTIANTAPTATPQPSLTTPEETALPIILAGVDPDVTENVQTFTFALGATAPAHGTLTGFNATTGAVTYTPALNYVGTDAFTFTVNDSSGASAPATVTINVTPVNDMPSFTKGANQTAAEDSGAKTVAAWATAIADGDAEIVQTLTFNVNNDNNALFSTQPAVAANGTLTYTPAADANGVATVSVTLTDDATAGGPALTTAAQTFTITVTPVNDAPVATDDVLGNIAEDSGVYTIPFATLTANDSKGPVNEAGQVLTITAVGNAVGGTVTISGTNVAFTPSLNHNGAASFEYTVQDNGQTNGVNDFKTDVGAATLTITEVNDAPVATNDTLTNIAEDSGVYTIPFATLTANDSKGPANEAGQTLTVTAVENAVGGTVAINGTNVEFTPTLNFTGAASFTYTVQDNGTTNGVADPKSAGGTATFTVTAVNDMPSFAKGADQTVLEDAGAQTAAGWATAIADGDPEVAQVLTFNVTTDNNALFAALPAVNPANGNLTYTTAPNANGNATVSVTLTDDTTAGGAALTTLAQTFTITVTAVNDAPSFTKGNNPAVKKDAGAQTFAGWATAFIPGPADEIAAGQTVAITSVTNNNNALFSVQPALALISGDLTFTPTAGATGVAKVTVELLDNGGTSNGGTATSTDTFMIIVGSPPWFPYFEWPAVGAYTWYNIQIMDGTTVIFDTNVESFKMMPADYILAGNDGLVCGDGVAKNYTYTYRGWNPETDQYQPTPLPLTQSNQPLEVPFYNYAEAPVLTNPAPTVDNTTGNVEFKFVAGNAQGYVLEVTNTTTNVTQTFTNYFMPDADDVVPLNQETTVNLSFAPGTYSWRVGGFNPLDTQNGTVQWTNGTNFTILDAIVPPDMSTTAAPTITSPVNNSVFPIGTGGAATRDVTFSWTSVPGATGYVIYLVELSGSLGGDFDFRDVGNVLKMENIPLGPGNYMLYVIAYSDAAAPRQYGPWSVAANFSVVRDLSAPTITLVTRTNPNILNLTWSGAAPATVKVLFYYMGAPQWQEFTNLPVVGGKVTLPGVNFAAATYNFVNVQGFTAANAAGPVSQTFYLP